MSNVIAQPTLAPFRLILQAPRSWPARRVLQIILGLVWLLDAALQLQPYMFSGAFVTKTIEPVAAGNPAVIAGPVLWSAHLMAHHIVLYNAVFAAIQLAIAAGLFVRSAVRLALAASIVWSAGVWWFGEGLGGLLTGGSPLMGLPGAVILYAFIALLVWPAGDGTGEDPRLAPALGGAGPGRALTLASTLSGMKWVWMSTSPGSPSSRQNPVTAATSAAPPGSVMGLPGGG